LPSEENQEYYYSDHYDYYGSQLGLLKAKEYDLVISPRKDNYLAHRIAKDVDKK
jgi:hypothetical protein